MKFSPFFPCLLLFSGKCSTSCGSFCSLTRERHTKDVCTAQAVSFFRFKKNFSSFLLPLVSLYDMTLLLCAGYNLLIIPSFLCTKTFISSFYNIAVPPFIISSCHHYTDQNTEELQSFTHTNYFDNCLPH